MMTVEALSDKKSQIMNSTSAPSSEKLALFGGKPAINDPDFMAYRWPFFSKEEKEAVSALVERTWFGDYYKEQAVFEKELCNYFGSKYAISLINGTAALHSGAFGAGFGPGDEVITPSYTYWATVMPLRLVGARPSSPTSWRTPARSIPPTSSATSPRRRRASCSSISGARPATWTPS